eukprot:SM000027S09690  [mRNA]  locus=s27:882897:883743:+ [translate_table: standard]
MLFKAEGGLSESAAPRVVKALEAVEGVSRVKVSLSEGCATVECTKLASVQATGVASGLVEVIQRAGFKMQALSLGFDDELEDDDGYGADYDDMLEAEGEAATA